MGVKTVQASSGLIDAADFTALAARERLLGGALSAVDLTTACLRRIAAHEDRIHAWACLDEEYALKQAAALDDYRRSGRPVGALHGLPVDRKW